MKNTMDKINSRLDNVDENVTRDTIQNWTIREEKKTKANNRALLCYRTTSSNLSTYAI